jgi:hypothetical protein
MLSFFYMKNFNLVYVRQEFLILETTKINSYSWKLASVNSQTWRIKNWS